MFRNAYYAIVIILSSMCILNAATAGTYLGAGAGSA
jgi:hypothetical protein